MITVIPLKISNIASVSRALKYLNVEHTVSDSPEDIKKADKLILPGVGSFAEGSKRLETSGLFHAIRTAVLENQKPILGICLGMQLFASHGEEGGSSQGLGLIQGHVRRMNVKDRSLALPHIGWNDVQFSAMPLFNDIRPDSCFYFVHSYEFIPDEKADVATCQYGAQVVAAIQKDHVVGTQFHPEKSQEAGLKLLRNFCEGFRSC